MLETVQAALELLCVPTTGGGSAWPGGGGGESHRSQISLPSRPKYMKTAKNGRVSRTTIRQTSEPFMCDSTHLLATIGLDNNEME